MKPQALYLPSRPGWLPIPVGTGSCGPASEWQVEAWVGGTVITDMVSDSLRGTVTTLACSTSALYWSGEAHTKAYAMCLQIKQDLGW